MVGNLAQERLELGLVEKADLRVAVLARPVDLLARVLRAPAALLAVGEDRVQQTEVVEHALGRAALPRLGGDEALNVARLDAMERRGAEERRQMHPQRRLVVHQRRALAAHRAQMGEIALARLGDVDARLSGDRQLRVEQPAQLAFGLGLGQAGPLAGTALRTEPALYELRAHPPLAVPGLQPCPIAPDDEGPGSVGPTAS